MRLHRFIPCALAALLTVSGCKSADKNVTQNAATGTRAPASSEGADNLENEFKALMASTDPGTAHINTLERMLRIYYRAELYVEEFNSTLDVMLARAKADQTYSADPLTTPAYQKLTGMWLLSRRELHKITYVYRRLIEVSRDPQATPATRDRAENLLVQTHKWLERLPEEDQIQMYEVYQHMTEIQKEFRKHADNSSGSKTRDIASIPRQWVSSWSERKLRHRVHADHAKIHRKALESAQWHDADADADYSWVSEAMGRMPNADSGTPAAPHAPDAAAIAAATGASHTAPSFGAPAPAAPSQAQGLAPTQVIYPSPGPNGNFYGRQLPPGIFVFTFDDGPAASSTARLQGILKSYRDPVNTKGAPATFFCLVKQVLLYPQVVAGTKAAGYHMNNHSWTHPNFAKLTPDELKHEVVDSTPVLEKAFGYKFRFFRCPYGACFAPAIPLVRQMIADQGLIHAYWAVDSADWRNIGQPQRTFDIATKQMQIVKRGAILIHDIHESSVDAAQMILNWIKEQNVAGQKIRLMDLESAVDLVNNLTAPPVASPTPTPSPTPHH